jgi:outer membrane protein assembly factor BamA
LKNSINRSFPGGLIILILLASTVLAQSKVETGDIDFKFNKTETFSETALLDILLLPREKYFNRINLEEDLQRLNKFYFDNGFFDASIDTATQYDKDDEQVNITFKVSENSRYTIKEIKLTGLDSVSPQAKTQIAENKLINAGDPYSKNTINLEKDRILSILQNHGYYYAQIDTVRSRIDSSRRGIIVGKFSEDIQENPEFKDKVLLRMRFIGTKDIYRFGNIDIDIEKNSYGISKPVIARELTFKEGDVYDKSKMLETERNFTKLAIIQIGRVLDDSVDTETKVVYPVVEILLNKKYELTPSLSAVYLTNKLFLGAGLEYRDKDFFGDGRIFSISLEGLYNSIDANYAVLGFSLFQPFLFNNNITATLTPEIAYINLNEFLQVLVLKNKLRLTNHIADYTFYNDAYSDITFDYLKLKAKKDYADETDTLYAGEVGYGVNSIIGLTLLHNNSNSLFNPSAGTFHSLSLENAGALPRLLSIFNKGLNFSQYWKISTINSTYFDISGGRATTILAGHFELGDIIEYGSGENILPVVALYKFFMGGGNSLRGWKAQSGGILESPEQGGKFLLEGSVELRRKPFPERSFLSPVWGVLFWDWGNVWQSDGKFRFNQIAMAAGFGIRYDTFVGPVRIDLGFKLYDPIADEGKKWLWNKTSDFFNTKCAIHFGLGNAF